MFSKFSNFPIVIFKLCEYCFPNFQKLNFLKILWKVDVRKTRNFQTFRNWSFQKINCFVLENKKRTNEIKYLVKWPSNKNLESDGNRDCRAISLRKVQKSKLPYTNFTFNVVSFHMIMVSPLKNMSEQANVTKKTRWPWDGFYLRTSMSSRR